MMNSPGGHQGSEPKFEEPHKQQNTMTSSLRVVKLFMFIGNAVDGFASLIHSSGTGTAGAKGLNEALMKSN